MIFSETTTYSPNFKRPAVSDHDLESGLKIQPNVREYNNPMIRVSKLRYSYPEGEFELNVPSLHIAKGETVAVIGPSGSGKTTLLHLIAGIVSPLAGRIEVDRIVVNSLDDSRRRDFRIRRVGMVFQEFELLEYLSVLDNILLPYRINSELRLDSAARARARSLAEITGIKDKLDRFATRLSQGEKQRVAVCRALVAEPVLLLADEPTGNLDPGNTQRVLSVLLEAAQATGATLLTVTHDHDFLSRFARVVDVTDLAAVGETS